MSRFVSEEIKQFLRAVDRHLKRSFTVEIIGGAAGALSLSLEGDTEDIDTITSVEAIEDALGIARVETGLNIPVGVAGIWDGPYGYRRRRKHVRITGIKRLKIYVPDKYDWALMKIVRLKDKDREHIKEAAEKVGFKSTTFYRRFVSDMTSFVCGPPKELVWNFCVMMSELYGEAEAEKIRARIERNRRWKKILREAESLPGEGAR